MVEKIANAVLYEGFLLYPYTPSSVKNQQRWNFGVLYPPGFDTSEMQTECLALAGGDGKLGVTVRFLEDGTERRMEIETAMRAVRRGFRFGGIAAEVDIAVLPVEGRLCRIRVRISNRSAFEGTGREQALPLSMASTHTILTLRGGEFVSLMDPPGEFREAAAACRNIGTWPVLAGPEGERDTMLSSPIILYDYPQVAPESPGDLFDSTEIDEILTLRILTLSDEEKAEIRAGPERAREILARSEALPPEQLGKLHGAIRGLRPIDTSLRQGDRVRLHPRRSRRHFRYRTRREACRGGSGRAGLRRPRTRRRGSGRRSGPRPGHAAPAGPPLLLRPGGGRAGRMNPTTLIAGIGNIFLGDDAFGSEVARRLLARPCPESVKVVDFGIRGFDLMFALLEGYETVILVDATPRGGAPGTLYTIEADLSELDRAAPGDAAFETHGMNPMRVLAAAKAMGARLGRIFVVGCEPTPESVDPDGPGVMGLSDAVRNAVDESVRVIETLVARTNNNRSMLWEDSSRSQGASS